MQKYQFRKFNRSIYNILISEIGANVMTLTRLEDSNGLVVVKLKRKVEYPSHVLLEPVRPSFAKSLF